MRQPSGSGNGLKASRASALSDYVQVLRRDAWIIAATVAAVALIAILFSLFQEDRYESRAEAFLLNTTSLPASFRYEQTLRDIDPERIGNTQARIARVPAVVRRALREGGFTDRTATDLLDNSTVSQPPDTDILRFTVNDADAAVATRLATAYATAYADFRRELDTAALASARTQIERRLPRLDPDSGFYFQLRLEVQRLRTAEELQSANASVIREGTAAEQVQPKPIRNGILGALLGLLLGVALVVTREGLNTRIRSSEEVEDILGLPMIGRVAKPSRRQVTHGLAMLDSPDAPETEAYRMIATNLGFVNLDRGAKVIMVTSAVDGEGKSTSVANLAIAMARAGSRVALIDFDLKRPSIDTLFDLDAAQFGVGVTGVALGQISLDDALIRIPVSDVDPAGSLDVLLTGQEPPDSAQFVASQRVTDLLARLSGRYDVVLVDAAPMVQASDAVALAGKVDAVIVIAGLSHVRRGTLVDLRRILDSTPVAKLGFVLTGVPMEDAYRHGYPPAGQGTNGSGLPGLRRQPVT